MIVIALAWPPVLELDVSKQKPTSQSGTSFLFFNTSTIEFPISSPVLKESLGITNSFSTFKLDILIGILSARFPYVSGRILLSKWIIRSVFVTKVSWMFWAIVFLIVLRALYIELADSVISLMSMSTALRTK